MPSFVETRSFLASNVDNLLENLNARRHSGKIDADDLFNAHGDEQSSVTWNFDYRMRSKIDALLEEKESLGLYVSGNPLEEYKDLLLYCRETAGRDDIHLILVDKIKKIFTKTNAMMFALEISTPETNLEGIIFPKLAPDLSPILLERELYWVKGKVNQNNKKLKAKKTGVVVETEDAMETVVEDVKEYDELPKLIINGLKPFSEGVLNLFTGEEIQLAVNRQKIFTKMDWELLKTKPSEFGNLVKPTEIPAQKELSIKKADFPTLYLKKSLGTSILKDIKKQIKTQPFPESVEVKIKVENSQGWKKAKGSFWVNKNLASDYRLKH